ncbi:elongation factor G [Pseudothauera nasutitermitis]|uniref:Elongation factor G n=1 Tax=Pseudothauera nasutitermitis TaxID=2565930 RepID=A0A4S4AT98_9RHOO|nr:elongation factor G [Pseudothauera nasutitermitis]THF62389.1 elongation factor G [Pseudothauera nasutitermitis]
MASTSVHDIRNLALLGQAGSGKTTLLEALLAAAGAIGASGSIERGDTVSDFDPMEKSMGHSLNTGLAQLEWAAHRLNLLDTPGTPDFLGRALLALPSVETAVVVVNAQAGVETVTRRAMEAAAGKCRMLVVNRIDASGADPAAVFDALVAAFGRECLPINLPTPERDRVIDCFFAPEAGAATAFSSVEAAHDAIVDQVVELDEALMAAYLEQGETLDPGQLHDPFERALREGHLIPVCFVSARSGAGVRELLDVFARLMPDPTEGNPPAFVKGEGAAAVPVEVAPDPARHALAHVFQIQNDVYRGKLALFRIHQGTITAGSQLYVGDARKPFKVTHLLRIQGRQQVEIAEGIAGDLCAVARVDELHRDAVLHDSHDEDYHHLLPPAYPRPVHGLALIPKKPGDEQKLSEALARLQDEDPCLETGFDAQTRQTVVHGLGELHLKVVLEQLATRWNLDLDTARPAVPYRETIAASAESRYRHKKQSGGAGQFGEVALRVEPLPRGGGLELVDEIKGGAIPTHFMPAVEKGVRQAVAEGCLAGFPLQDLRVTVVDGKHHAVDSNEVSFVTAARHALLEAVAAARPTLLEPLLEVRVSANERHFGEISAEFSSRRGRMSATDSIAPGRISLSALVPMAELDGFEIRLKAICAGESECTLALHSYEPAPGDAQQRLAGAHAQRRAHEQ